MGQGVGDDHRAWGPEALERLALFGGWGEGGAHDWLVVTLLTPLLELLFWELDELSLEPEDDDASPDVVDVPEVEVEAVEAAADFFANAGSWPETSTTVISNQLATNRATAPAMMRR